jgi:hypothetical protein
MPADDVGADLDAVLLVEAERERERDLTGYIGSARGSATRGSTPTTPASRNGAGSEVSEPEFEDPYVDRSAVGGRAGSREPPCPHADATDALRPAVRLGQVRGIGSIAAYSTDLLRTEVARSSDGATNLLPTSHARAQSLLR